MKYEEFLETYKPVLNHLDDNASFDGWMFETFGEEVNHVVWVANTVPNTVWTLVESDNGDLEIIAGYWLVNRMGYFITENPWGDKNITVEL